jgi:repressor LexA
MASRGRSPSLSEIGRLSGLSSVATVHRHLTLLEERGLLRRRGRRRVIELLPAAFRAAAIEVPLAGRIAAGRPIEAIAETRTVILPRTIARRGRTYVLRVSGDSMIDEQIRDGDYIVVEETRVARDGQTVVALLEGGDATLKILRRRRGRIRLQPANPSLEPIDVRPEDLRIQGVVTGLLRSYD